MNGRKLLSLKGVGSVNLHFGESFLTRIIADEYVCMVEKPINVTVLISKRLLFTVDGCFLPLSLPYTVRHYGKENFPMLIRVSSRHSSCY